MKLKNFLEVINLLTDNKYSLERIYSKQNDIVCIKYKIMKNGSEIMCALVIAPYNSFDTAIDYIEEETLKELVEKLKDEISIN
jgi:hypothetical protein